MKALSDKTIQLDADQAKGDPNETLADKIARYGSSEFAARVTRHFHQAKRKALMERDAALAKDQNRSA
jgi:hypothetical protein